MGRWDSVIPRQQRLELMQKIENELKNCGITETQLEAAKTDWHFYNVIDQAYPAYKIIHLCNSASDTFFAS